MPKPVVTLEDEQALDALHKIILVLEKLSYTSRKRVMDTVQIFYGIEGDE